MKRIVPVVLSTLALAGPAAAHDPGAPTTTGYIATVSAIRPNILGVRATAVLGDEVLVSNLSPKPVVILDQAGKPIIRVPRGESRAWHDVRVVARGDPPPPTAGADETDPRFVKNWSIPARSGSRRFAIEGFLGWVPPEQSNGRGVGKYLLAAGALALLAVSLLAVWALGRKPRRGET